MARMERRTPNDMVGSVLVTPANEAMRVHLKHPGNGIGFGATMDETAEWPNDAFTKRRLRDGDVNLHTSAEELGKTAEEARSTRRDENQAKRDENRERRQLAQTSGVSDQNTRPSSKDMAEPGNRPQTPVRRRNDPPTSEVSKADTPT